LGIPSGYICSKVSRRIMVAEEGLAPSFPL